MSPSVQAIRRFLEAHDRFAAHNGITVEDADYDYGKVSNATISYMKSAKTGPIVAEARLANGGRHLATYEVKIYDGQGTYIACAMISGYRLDTKLAIEE